MQFFSYTEDSSVNERWYSGASEEQSCYTYKKTVTQQEKKRNFSFPLSDPPLELSFQSFSWKEKKGKTYARVMMYQCTAIFPHNEFTGISCVSVGTKASTNRMKNISRECIVVALLEPVIK